MGRYNKIMGYRKQQKDEYIKKTNNWLYYYSKHFVIDILDK